MLAEIQKQTVSLENVLQFLTELHIYLYNLAVAFLNIYSRKRKTYSTKICIQILLTAIIVKDLNGNNPNVLKKVNEYKN